MPEGLREGATRFILAACERQAVRQERLSSGQWRAALVLQSP